MWRVYFEGEDRYRGNNYAKLVLGQETMLDATKQYADYAITIHRRPYTQGWSHKVDEGRTYHFLVEVGRHSQIEDLLNQLAAKAGVPSVQALAK